MLIRLSRLLFWLAACAAAASLLGPAPLGTWLTAAAGVALLGAYVLWRLAAWRLAAQAAPEDDGLLPPTVQPDDESLLEVATRLTRALAAERRLAPALGAAARVLRNELGARQVAAHLVRSVEGREAVVATVLEAPADGIGGDHRVRLSGTRLGEAIASGRTAGSHPGPLALPVDHDGRVLGVLELGEIALPIGAPALESLLEQARLQLAAVAAREAETDAGAAHELVELQLRMREFAATLDESLFISDPLRARFEFLAGTAYDTWGFTQAQLEQRPACFLDNVVAEDRPILAARRERELRAEGTDVSFRIQHPDKGLRWLRSRSRTRRMPDGSLRVYGMVADITDERQRATDLERARDQAQAASAAKSQFMANMSHEIRTPMNGILGMTELLLGTALNDRQRRFAQAVYRSGEALLEIINDILDFSKIEAGKLELAPTDFALRSVVEDTLELLAPRAHERGLELSFREQSGLPAVVHGDPLRLRQVLTNLIANAIKFTETGEIVVDVRLVPDEAEAEADGPRPLVYEFGVRDTGIGIQADAIPRLFTAFEQANGGMSRRYGGTGLGLAISRQLVELMGGRITVRSAPGLGSEFRFTAPLAAAAEQTPASDEADLSALRVLVVEDNLTNRTVVENLLGAWGLAVTLAEDGQAALDLLAARDPAEPPFDLALVDMQMPRLDGLGFAHALRERGLQPDMKLILLSSLSTPDDVRAAHLAGFDRFVAKPIRRCELRQALVGVTSSRGDGPPAAVPVNRRVLVVEDNRVNQEVIGQMLRRLGCEVQLAASATEGLRALCEQSFDLVLMDIQMPGMDGIEALHWFRRGGHGRYAFVTPTTAPVFAVTANALGGDRQRFLDLGFDDYLSKPFRQSQLQAMLTRHLTPSAPVPPDEAPSPGGAAGPAPAAGVLDEEALARLRELDPKGENKLLERVLRAFETSVARLLPQLEDARQTGDRAGIRHVAHTLKSSSASIGAIKLSQQCADIEAMIRLDKADDLDARVDAMCAEVQIVLQALRNLMDGAK